MPSMLRLMHMADVHLGARHHDLGSQAAAQRERQFAAFKRAIDIAIAERVELVLICGDLFDSNSQPRRSIERAAAELRRLTDRHVRVVIIPGTHDCYDSGSIYRVFDLPALVGGKNDASNGRCVVLTDVQPMISLPELDATVHGRVFATKKAPTSPLAGFNAREAGKGTKLQIGMIHGARYVPGQVEQDDVIFTDDEIAASGLDYLALGHWHSYQQGRAGNTTWAYSGAPEPVQIDQDGAGQVLLVTLEPGADKADVKVEARAVGRTKLQKLTIDGAEVGSQVELAARLRELANPDLVLDVRLVGVTPDNLDLHLDEIEQQLAGSFLRLRIVDASKAALPEGERPPADTIAGAFVRTLETRIAKHEAAGETEAATELREALRVGRLLLDDPQRVALV
jgi:DNA repair exonuclease SbcCD nuclease subunit